MERLTKTYDDGTHAVADNLPCGENSWNYKELLLNKLGAYEDTGLTPEEIMDGKMLTGWIPVEERMPDSGSEVLAYIRHNYAEDCWRAYRVYRYTDHWVGMGNLCDVLAWMPLPEPFNLEN